GFDARFGPKVECRWIILPNDNHAAQLWREASEGEAGFVKIAKTNNIPQLCPKAGGGVPPIHKNFGDAKIEQVAFNLKVGEISPLLEMPDHTVVILKCDKHIQPDYTKRLEEE